MFWSLFDASYTSALGAHDKHLLKMLLACPVMAGVAIASMQCIISHSSSFLQFVLLIWLHVTTYIVFKVFKVTIACASCCDRHILADSNQQ